MELTIGGYKGDLPPDTELIKCTMDPISGRRIVWVPFIVNEVPRAGKPFVSRTGERMIPSIIAQTNIRECSSISLEGPLEGLSIRGFGTLQIAGLSPEEITERWNDAEAASQDGTHLTYDWELRKYITTVADSTDDISTTHTFDSRPPNFDERSASLIQKDLAATRHTTQSAAQNHYEHRKTPLF